MTFPLRITTPWIVLSLLGTGCAADPDAAPDFGAGNADEPGVNMACSFLNPDVPAIKTRFAPVKPSAVAELAGLKGVPVPTIGDDSEGFFFPARGVTSTADLAGTRDAKADYIEELGFDATAYRAGNGEVGVPVPYIEGGAFPAVGPARAPGEIRAAVWNTARGKKLDEVIAQMKAIDADIWVINEADFHGKSSGGRAAARDMARALGYSYVAAGEFYELRSDRRGLSGNAIVSRFPLFDVQAVYLPMFGGRDWASDPGINNETRCGQRNALSAHAEIPMPDGSTQIVNIISAHLENAALQGTRDKQFALVRNMLAVPGEATLMAGDWNTLGLTEGDDLRNRLGSAASGTQSCGTGPSANAGKCAKSKKDGFPYTFTDCSHGDNTDTFSLGRIDWFTVQSGDGAVPRCEPGDYAVVTEAKASDHKPIRVDLTLE